MAVRHVIELKRRTTLESAVRRHPSHVIVVINIMTQLLAHNIHGRILVARWCAYNYNSELLAQSLGESLRLRHRQVE